MGVVELTVDAGKVAGGTGQPQLLIGLLLPAVQGARETVVARTIPFPATRQLHLKLGVMMDGRVSSIDWGEGKQAVAVADINSDGRADFSGGVRVAAGDVTGDGYLKAFGDLAKKGAPGETRIGFFVPSSGGDATPAKKDEPTVYGQTITFTATVSKVGLTATGPGGVFQLSTNEQGVARLGKLGMGNTTLDVNGADLASALKTAGGPAKPARQETLIELLVVIAIVAIKTDGQPVVFTGSLPANALPKSLKANLRVGRDGNLMDVDWGNGPQQPQGLAVIGGAFVAGIAVWGIRTAGNDHPGSTMLNAGPALNALQETARGGKPGDVSVSFFAHDPNFVGGKR